MRKLALLLLLSSSSWAVTCPSGYTNYRTITIDHTQVGATDSNNFTLLLSTTLASLKTTGNGGNIQNANGYDLVFSSASDGSFALKFETETYNASTGKINYWVKVGMITHSSNVTLYAFYNNSGVSTFQGGSVGSAWDSFSKGIYHLNNVGSTTPDSSSSGWYGDVTSASASTGLIGNAASLSSTAPSLIALNSMAMPVGDITVSAWLNISDTGGYWQEVASEYYLGSEYFAMAIRYGGYSALINGKGGQFEIVLSPSFTFNTWQHIVYVMSSAGTNVYLNGSLAGTNGTANGLSDTHAPAWIASWHGTSGYLSGLVDETQFSSVARGADWITAEYNNQKSGANMVTWGAETSCSGGGGGYVPVQRGVSISGGKTKISGGKVMVQ